MPNRQAIQVPGLKTIRPYSQAVRAQACCLYLVSRALILPPVKRPVSPLTFKLDRRSRILIPFYGLEEVDSASR